MNQFFNFLNSPMMNVVKYAQQIKQNPEMLAKVLYQRGMVSEQQMKDIQKMGGNYAQVGEYLMQNGKMPTNIQQYESQVNNVQNMLK